MNASGDPHLGPQRTVDDDACEKLWEVYLNEAERYDEGLVRSWKEDMDVTLVFSGLYSAVLTGFVVESYKNLQPDAAQQSVSVLLRLSEQLSVSSNGSTIPPASLAEFSAPPGAIACNICWFLSLSLALCCAFLATFVQQWTRHFLHRTTMLRSSTARANLFSFLYFGLKDFGMHTVVEIIPSLLHLSLFSFFAGLVAFLNTVNSAIQWLVIGALAIITIIYSGFTIMPILAFNSPYQTPLSPLVWRFRQFATSIVREAMLTVTTTLLPSRPEPDNEALPTPTAKPPSPTLAEAMIVASRHDAHRRARSSLAWTLKSLNSDPELLPFVEALPDVIYSPLYGLHTNNFSLLRPIVESADPQADIILRITSLIQGLGNPWLTDKHRERCRVACPRALWALAYMITQFPDTFCLSKTGRLSWFSLDILNGLTRESLGMGQRFAIPASALIASSILTCAETCLQRIKSSPLSGNNPKPLLSFSEVRTFFHPNLLPNRLQYNGQIVDLCPGVLIDERIATALVDVCDYAQARVLVGFLRDVVSSPSHLLEPTYRGLQCHQLACSSFPTTDVYRMLLMHYKRNYPDRKLQHHNADTESSETELYLDRVFSATLDLANKEEALLASEYIARRVDINCHQFKVTANIWTGQWGKIRAFLQIVDDYGPRRRSCIEALREVLFCSIVLPMMPPHKRDVDTLPLWMSILSKLEAKSGNPSKPPNREIPPLFPLTIMIKSMLLSRADLDLVVNLLGASIRTTLPSSNETSGRPRGIRRAIFMDLLTQLLEGENQGWTAEAYFGNVQNTLRYMRECHSDVVISAAYHIHPDLALRFAIQTRRYCELWRDKSSPELFTILETIWQLWYPLAPHHPSKSIMFGTAQPEVVRDILTKLSEGRCMIEDTRARIEIMTEARQGYENLTRYEGLRIFRWPYHLASNLDVMKTWWDEMFPLIVPLPASSYEEKL